MKRTLAIAASAALALASLSVFAPPANAAENVVPDAQFQQCLNGYLSGQTDTEIPADAPITAAQLNSLTGYVDCSSGGSGGASAGIASIEGAQYLTGVESLYIDNGSIKDTSPLQNLTKLTSLELYGNQLTSIDLSNLVHLTYIGLGGNQLTTLDLEKNAELTGVSVYNNQLTSLTLGTNIYSIDASNNKLTTLDLSGNKNLNWVDVTDNQLTKLSLGGDTKLDTVYASNNKLTSLDLSTNTSLSYLGVSDNKLTSLDLSTNTYLRWADASNNQLTSVSGLNNLNSAAVVNLNNNQIADVSALAGNAQWYDPATPSEYAGSGWSTTAHDQTLPALNAVKGTTVALPTVAGHGPAVTWSVKSGPATINADGTVTYTGTGAVVLAFTDASASSATCASYNDETDQVENIACPAKALGSFDGTVSVNVTAEAVPSTPSAPDSTVTTPATPSASTNGTAREADGSDPATVTVTVKDASGQPLTGFAASLAATATPAGATVSAFTDNGDGTYTAKVTSSKPGTYSVKVTLNGEQLGSPQTVSFIGATASASSVTTGGTVTVTASGFQPDEVVVATMSGSDAAAQLKADENGIVVFDVDTEGVNPGRVEVTFTGATSGGTTAVIEVTAANNSNGGGNGNNPNGNNPNGGGTNGGNQTTGGSQTNGGSNANLGGTLVSSTTSAALSLIALMAAASAYLVYRRRVHNN